MSKIPVKTFLAKVEEIIAQGQSYEKGKDGSHGECDCIGLIIGAIRRAGGQWRGIHGSNYAIRQEVDAYSKIEGKNSLTPGEVVFKRLEPGANKYDLKPRYEPGGAYYNGDVGDYYHIGVVLSVSPLRIRHMTSPKAKIDTDLGAWSYHGWLKKVARAESEIKEREGIAMETKAKIVPTSTSKGDTVNLREKASRDARVVVRVPFYAEITVLQDFGQWCQIKWNNKTGYVMSDFVEYGGADGETGEVVQDDLNQVDRYLTLIEKNNQDIQTLQKANDELIDKISSIVGRG